MTGSQRLYVALLALARGLPLTEQHRIDLKESGWADATQRQARAELEEQARRLVARK